MQIFEIPNHDKSIKKSTSKPLLDDYCIGQDDFCILSLLFSKPWTIILSVYSI